MRVADILRLLDSRIDPGKTKVHLASWNGRENPLDVYLAGNFYEWQRWQTRRNFERPFVLSLIALPETNCWLFAGVHVSSGCVLPEGEECYYYNLEELPSCSELNGRLIAQFKRPGRQSYLNADNWVEQIILGHILPKKMTIAHFPGFKSVDLSKAELEVIVQQNLESWRTALSNVAGVYLISDTSSGQLYVGSATGEGGIWQRWCQYAVGHGGNVELKALFDEYGPGRASAFRFSVLEIADTHASDEEIIGRESHWKKVLLSRAHGLNGN
ncbi:GIY-YIG nuclease family protein [Solimonas sp. K1W22B-7]|uniref:GIY-YIG nuclease family protein n=1 Tax=Solimonas sp. K1W22B-7 TaxID=2303331 RepID=UPI000E330862|nr:GIY-YIG nuclease family protein [Solimonas sp. K1W22B-7]AXQ28350.1 GIY-YIG nuclease family protein [Solimonas sp. K1W22B-7]